MFRNHFHLGTHISYFRVSNIHLNLHSSLICFHLFRRTLMYVLQFGKQIRTTMSTKAQENKLLAVWIQILNGKSLRKSVKICQIDHFDTQIKLWPLNWKLTGMGSKGERKLNKKIPFLHQKTKRGFPFGGPNLWVYTCDALILRGYQITIQPN